MSLLSEIDGPPRDATLSKTIRWSIFCRAEIFVPWRFSDAGHRSTRNVPPSRHPKT